MNTESCQKYSKIISSEDCVYPPCNTVRPSSLFRSEQKRIPFNFMAFCIFASLLPVAGLILGIIQQSTMIALGSILGFWGLIYLCLWLMCAVDCFQAKDGTGFLLLLLLPVIGMLLVVALRER